MFLKLFSSSILPAQIFSLTLFAFNCTDLSAISFVVGSLPLSFRGINNLSYLSNKAESLHEERATADKFY